MPTYQQNRVSQTVWPWTGPRQGVVKKGLPRQARALIQTAVMLVIAFVLFKWRPEHVTYKVVLTLAGIVLVSGLVIPPVFLAIERFGQWLGRNVALGVTWLLLVPFFYLCFVPARLLLAVRGKDPLARRFPTEAKTYWEPRPPIVDMAQYRKQH